MTALTIYSTDLNIIFATITYITRLINLCVPDICYRFVTEVLIMILDCSMFTKNSVKGFVCLGVCLRVHLVVSLMLVYPLVQAYIQDSFKF